MTMEQMKDNICRLCLKFGGDTFSDFSDLSSKNKLKTVLSELNLDNPSDFVICSRCRTLLDEYYQFTKTFKKNEDFIRGEKNRLKIVNSINLNRIIKYDSGMKRDMSRNVCRICLNFKYAEKYTSLNKAKTDKSFFNALETCFPKLMIQELSVNPVLCQKCLSTLYDMCEFKTDCMIVEQKVIQYSKTSSEKQIDLNKVLDSLKTQKSKVTSHPQNTDTNKKRPLSKEESDVVPSKKQKSSKEENNIAAGQTAPTSEGSKDMTLPYFNFHYNLLCDAKHISKLEKWLSVVDMLKKENDWTDLMTINKVLEKLKDESEIYPFFSNIAKIFKWEEWKKKLIEAFPDKDDYGALLRRMIKRQLRPNETYVNYYDAKMEILTAMNITGEGAVSCLLGGITKAVVGCIGRIGNYKKPEDLRLYFEMCDKKVVKKPAPIKKPLPRCRYCRSVSHTGEDCLKFSGRKTYKKMKARRHNRKEKLNIERRNREKGKATAQKPQSHEANGELVSSSASSQKQIEQSSSTTTIRGKENTEASNVKPQQEVVVANTSSSISNSTSQERKSEANLSDKQSDKETSTATQPKLGKDTDRVSKQDRSDGKDVRNATVEKQSKQNDDDACFVKPQPPIRKITPSSAISQSKGGSSNRPQAQKAISTPTTKQSEGSNKRDTTSSERKPPTKENKVDISNTRTQAQSKDRREAPSTKPRAHDEKSDRDTSATNHKEQKKENSNSNVRSSNFVKPQASVGGGNSTRGTSGQRKEVDHRTITTLEQRARNYTNKGTTVATPQDWRRESYSSRGVSSSRSQRDREEDYVNRGTSASTLPDRTDGSYHSRGTSNVRLQEYLEGSYLGDRSRWHFEESTINRDQSDMDGSGSNIRPREERDVGYVSMGMSDIRPEEQIEGYYSRRDLLRFEEPVERGASRSQEEGDGSYSRRDRYVRPDEQSEGIYSRRDLLSERFEEPVERGASKSLEEINVGYDRRDTYLRPEEQGVGSYSRRDLSSKRFEEPVEQGASRSQEERDVGYDRRNTYVRPEEQGMGSYSRRDLSSERFEEPVERGAPRSQERDDGYSRRDMYVRPDDQSVGSYSRRDLLSEKFEEPVERGASWSHKERDVSYDRRDTHVRPKEQGGGSYSRRDLSNERFEKPVERGASRSQEERDVSYDRRDTFRPEEQGVGSYSRRDLSSERVEEPVERGASNARLREARDAGYSRRDASVRFEKQSMGSYSRRDLLGERFQKPEEQNASIVRSQDELELSYAEKYRREIDGDNINKSVSSDRRREDNEMYNRGTLKTTSPVQDEGSNVNRNLSGARPEEVWESSYVDRDVTSVRREGRDEEGINKGAVSVRRPEDKEMEGRSFMAVESMDRSYLNRDAPTARPGDGSYPNKVVPPTNPREFKEGSYVNRSTLPSERMSGRSDESYLNRSTLPSERMPVHSNGSYFNKSISSSRLLGSSLGSLFSLSLATRPFTSYPSSATTAKPLGLGSASYFNRGLPHNRMQDYSEKSKGMSDGMFARRDGDVRGQKLAVDNSLLRGPGLPRAGHQEQSHREMCLRCYTIGHNSVDCPRFKTT